MTKRRTGTKWRNRRTRLLVKAARCWGPWQTEPSDGNATRHYNLMANYYNTRILEYGGRTK